jgi:uncharacterized membrane protein
MTDVPPAGGSPASGPESPQPSGTPVGGSGLPENVAGALCYLLGPITGIVFFIIDRPRPFVRFHAVQSIALTIAWVVLWVALTILGLILNIVPILGTIIGVLIWFAVTLGGFGLWLWLMFQAYQGNTWEIPGLGPHVRRLASETGGPPSSSSY